MKKFKCKVIREDEYEIEIDESIFDKEAMEHFKRYFYDFEDYEDHAEYIAQFRARFGERFIEGYGNPKVNGELPLVAKIHKNELKTVNHAININVINEDKDIEVEVEEVCE